MTNAVEVRSFDIDKTARVLPIDDDTMDPTFRRGDAVAVLPCNGFEYDAIYVLEVAERPRVYRCSNDFRGGITISSDNALHKVKMTVPRAVFDQSVLGRVVGHFRRL